MALLDTNLLFQHSVVRLRATAADGVKLRTLLSTSEPLRLDIFDGADNKDKKESFTLVATVKGGREGRTPSVSRAVFLTFESGGVAYLRLDILLSELIGEVASSEKFGLFSDAHFDKLIPLPTFRVAIHFTAASVNSADRLFPLSTVILRAEGVDFPFTRELLCLHSEFFCALLYGPFAEPGKDLVDLDTFTAEEVDILHRVIQCRLPVKTESAMAVLAVADRVLFHSLKAEMLALPIPNNQEEKEEWLIGADKYNIMELANRIVLSMPRREVAKVHLKLLDKISNKEVYRFMLMHSLGEQRDPPGTIISMDLGNFGMVRFRLLPNQGPEVVKKFLQMLPRKTTLLAWGTGFYIPNIPITWSKTITQNHATEWSLCCYGHQIYFVKGKNSNRMPSIGELVDGVDVLEGSMQGKNTICTISAI